MIYHNNLWNKVTQTCIRAFHPYVYIQQLIFVYVSNYVVLSCWIFGVYFVYRIPPKTNGVQPMI